MLLPPLLPWGAGAGKRPAPLQPVPLHPHGRICSKCRGTWGSCDKTRASPPPGLVCVSGAALSCQGAAPERAPPQHWGSHPHAGAGVDALGGAGGEQGTGRGAHGRRAAAHDCVQAKVSRQSSFIS